MRFIACLLSTYFYGYFSNCFTAPVHVTKTTWTDFRWAGCRLRGVQAVMGGSPLVMSNVYILRPVISSLKTPNMPFNVYWMVSSFHPYIWSVPSNNSNHLHIYRLKWTNTSTTKWIMPRLAIGHHTTECSILGWYHIWGPEDRLPARRRFTAFSGHSRTVQNCWRRGRPHSWSSMPVLRRWSWLSTRQMPIGKKALLPPSPLTE